MEDRHKRWIAIAGMLISLNLAVFIFFLGDLVFAGTFLVLFSFSIYFYEINR